MTSLHSVTRVWERLSLVCLQVLDLDQDSLLVKPSGRVLLGHLLALLGLGVSGLLGHPGEETELSENEQTGRPG